MCDLRLKSAILGKDSGWPFVIFANILLAIIYKWRWTWKGGMGSERALLFIWIHASIAQQLDNFKGRHIIQLYTMTDAQGLSLF